MPNFKSGAAYKKWLAYGHMHDVFHGTQPVSIRGKPHKVNHSKRKRRSVPRPDKNGFY